MSDGDKFYGEIKEGKGNAKRVCGGLLFYLEWSPY